MAFNHTNISDTTTIPGLHDFLAVVLPKETGLQFDIAVRKSAGVLLTVKSKDIRVWVCNNADDPEKAGIIVVYKATQNPFQDEYALKGPPDAFKNARFWSNSWLLYSNLNAYTLPPEFMDVDAVGEIKTVVESNLISLSPGMNIIYQWNLKEALLDLQLGPFKNLIPQEEDTKSLLLANEQAEGMMFSLVLDLKDGKPLPIVSSNTILKVDWACFSLRYPFSNSDLQKKIAEVSANVTLFGEVSATLEANFKPASSADEHWALDLAVYPDKAFGMDDGLNELFRLLGLGAMPTFQPALPNKLPTQLALQSLRLSISDTGMESFSAELALEAEKSKEGWMLLKDVFTLYGIYIQINWQKSGKVSFQAGGAMNALGYDFLVSYAHPARVINARLAPGSPKGNSIKEITTAVGFPDDLALGLNESAKVPEISMSADIGEQELEIRLRNQESWKIAEVIGVKNLDLRFECFNNWGFSGASLNVEMDLPIGKNKASNNGRENVTVYIDAEYDKNNNIWSFEGETGEGQDIPIGDAINALSHKVGGNDITLPEAVSSLVVRNIYLQFDNNGNAEFTCESSIKIGAQELDFWVLLKRTPQGNDKPKFEVAGTLFVAGIRLGVAFQSGNGSKYIIGTLQAPLTLRSKDLIEAIAPDIAEDVPFEVDIQHEALLLAIYKNETKDPKENKYLFRLSFNLNVNLQQLPLIGNILPDELKFTDGVLLAANDGWDDSNVSELNEVLSNFKENRPSQLGATNQDNGSTKVNRGISLGMQLQLPKSKSIPLFLSMGGNKKAAAPQGNGEESFSLQATGSGVAPSANPGGPEEAPSGSTGNIQWVKVNKIFGPVQLNRLGFQFEPSQKMLWAYLDAGLTIGPLAFTLNGLGIGTPLTKFKPEVQLLGIGVDFKSGSLEIGGSFLRNGVPEDQSKGRRAYDEYNGLALIKTPTILLSAIGSYADLTDHKSLFIFATLNAPIGGPAFFFVTGLAAAFGYNRALSVPDITRVGEFSLVNMAVSGASGPPPGSPGERSKYISAVLDQMRKDIYPAEGQYFLAAGVRFTSFNLIDSFVLLTVSFGKRLEVDVLGLSTAVIPAPVKGERRTAPLAEIQLALKAVFIPDEGFLGVEAQLTGNSYVIDRNCRLTGGFAFYTWFSGPHEGDFVLSVGGYHPAFRKPAHYPDVPRLGLNWQVTSKLSITGSMYFALCPHTVMAGGRLEAAYRDGSLKAWFIMGVDFIMGWKPFYYDLRAYLEIGIEYSMLFTVLRAQINADIHIWGPDFAGHARIKVAFLTFEIDFGAQSSPALTPLSWDAFRESFLPREDTKMVSLAAAGGLVKSIKSDKDDIYIINPKDFKLVANLAIPANILNIASEEVILLCPQPDHNPKNDKLQRVIRQQGAEICAFARSEQSFVQKQGSSTIAIGKFGIAPMGKSADAVTSKFTITATKDGNDASNDFAYRPVLKTMPAALWGERLQPDLNGVRSIENLMVGLEILPANPPQPGNTQWVAKSSLQYATAPVQTGAASMITAFSKSDLKGVTLIEHFKAQNRQTLLDAMGFGLEIKMPESIIENLVMKPQIGHLLS